MPKLSVIVPVYNAEKYLDKCIKSIIGQIYTDFELILIDDGSPDLCPLICDEWKQKDRRIKVVHKENQGVAIARNIGLDLAIGEYVTFVDSDDWLEPTMYLEMLKVLENYKCDVVMCDCTKEYGNYSESYSHNIRSGYYNYEQLKREYYPHLLMMENVEYPATISNWLIIFRREIQKSNTIKYIPKIRYSEDLLFGSQILYCAKSMYYMKGQNLYHYNCSNINSATHIFNQDKWKDYIKLYYETKKYFLNQEYDFEVQIDKMLLFFVYNSIGDIISAKGLLKTQQRQLIYSILNAMEVKEMFHRLRILKLPITWKLKIITIMYKYKVGISILIRR